MARPKPPFSVRPKRPYGLIHQNPDGSTFVAVDTGDGEHDCHIALFASKPEALAYLANLGYCDTKNGQVYRLNTPPLDGPVITPAAFMKLT